VVSGIRPWYGRHGEMLDDVPASVHALRFSAAFLGGLDTFLADAVTSAEATPVLANG
jgi:hypothetical protein